MVAVHLVARDRKQKSEVFTSSGFETRGFPRDFCIRHGRCHPSVAAQDHSTLSCPSSSSLSPPDTPIIMSCWTCDGQECLNKCLFLNGTCRYCGQHFCAKHLTDPVDHSCVTFEAEEKSRVGSRHSDLHVSIIFWAYRTSFKLMTDTTASRDVEHDGYNRSSGETSTRSHLSRSTGPCTGQN